MVFLTLILKSRRLKQGGFYQEMRQVVTHGQSIVMTWKGDVQLFATLPGLAGWATGWLIGFFWPDLCDALFCDNFLTVN